LLPEEEAILRIIREKYPANPRDEIFFIDERHFLMPVSSSAHGEGPWIHITNLAAFVKDGMNLDEVKETQIWDFTFFHLLHPKGLVGGSILQPNEL